MFSRAPGLLHTRSIAHGPRCVIACLALSKPTMCMGMTVRFEEVHVHVPGGPTTHGEYMHVWVCDLGYAFMDGVVKLIVLFLSSQPSPSSWGVMLT